MIHNVRFLKRRFPQISQKLLLIVSIAALAIGFGVLSLSGQTMSDLNKQVDEITQTAMKAAVAHDSATWSGLFLEDAILCPQNEPDIKGRDAIQAWMAKLPPITDFKLFNEKVEGRDDLAYVYGTYTMTFTPPGAPAP